MEPAGVRVALRIWVALVLLFLFLPILLIVVYAFDPATVESWPIKGFTLHWFTVAWHDPQVRDAFLLSSSSLAVTRSRSCSCCRSRCPGSSRVSR